MENKSGITPLGDRVLVKPEKIDEITEGGIVIPDQVRTQHALAQSIGYVVALGPDCWIDHVDFGSDGAKKGYTGFTKPQARVGDRVVYAKYAGVMVPGKDSPDYRIIRDKDVAALVDPEIDFTDLRARKAFAQQEES